jgi:hypothetical protein
LVRLGGHGHGGKFVLAAEGRGARSPFFSTSHAALVRAMNARMASRTSSMVSKTRPWTICSFRVRKSRSTTPFV